MFVDTGKHLLIPLNSWKEIPWRVNQFFKFLVELLGVWPYILYTPSFDVLLDLVPVLAIEPERLEKEIVFLSGPAADLVLTILWLGGCTSAAYLLRDFDTDALDLSIPLFGCYFVTLTPRVHAAARVLSENGLVILSEFILGTQLVTEWLRWLGLDAEDLAGRLRFGTFDF